MTEQKKTFDPKSNRATELDDGQLEQSSGGAEPITELKRPPPRPAARSTADRPRAPGRRNEESEMTEQKKPQERKTGGATELDERQLEQSSGGAEPISGNKRPPPRPAEPIAG